MKSVSLPIVLLLVFAVIEFAMSEGKMYENLIATYQFYDQLMAYTYILCPDLNFGGGCECAPGTSGKCAENLVPKPQCKEIIEMACPTETYEEAAGNGCKNCAFVRHYCATSCNFCTPKGDISEIPEEQ